MAVFSLCGCLKYNILFDIMALNNLMSTTYNYLTNLWSTKLASVLHYKSFTIINYYRNDSRVTIYDRNDIGQNYKTIVNY